MSGFAVKLFEGDDRYSYAVFHKDAVKGLGKIIFYNQACPIVSGLSRNEANHYKKQMESK